MTRQGKNLIFISQINRDGSGTKGVDFEYIKILQEQWFTIRCLSLSNGTYIASGFNSFVVKLVGQDPNPPMEKAWDEHCRANVQQSANDHSIFDDGWLAAEKHFNQKNKLEQP